jgi:hypothetical protein
VYSINDTPLHEGHAGWRVLRSGTNTQVGVNNSLVRVPNPGRPGYKPAPHTQTEGVIVLIVRTPRARLEELLALCASAHTLKRTDDPTKVAHVELASAIPSSDAPFDAMQDVSITLSVYEGVWRDVDLLVEGPTSIVDPVQFITALDGLSAPVFDGDFFLRGDFDDFVLQDVEDWANGGGSWVKTIRSWPGSSLTGLLYIGSTQQAFLANNSDPWTPLSDMSSYIDVNGNGGFRMTPNFVDGDPADRRVTLKLTTINQTSVTLRTRARRAYRMN